MAIRYSTLVDISISIDIYAMYQLPDVGGSEPGPRAREASGEARAAHRVGPRRRRRALAERGPTGRALAEQRLRARLGLASLLSQRGGQPRLLTAPRSRAVSTRCRPKVGLATPNHKEMRAEALTVKNSH